MDTDQVSVFLALLAFMALGVGVLALVIVAAGKAEKLRPVADVLLPLALVVALTSTLGSLYYSGVANFRPCRLCWWQRIMMYPMVPVLGIATFRKDVTGAWYASHTVAVVARRQRQLRCRCTLFSGLGRHVGLCLNPIHGHVRLYRHHRPSLSATHAESRRRVC